MGVTRARRNNNPVNLRFAGQREAIGKDEAGFAIFPDVYAGWRAAMAQILLDARRGLSIREYIYKFAPPSENDTEGYLSFVLKRMGGRVENDQVKLSRLSLPDLVALLMAQAEMEGFYRGVK